MKLTESEQQSSHAGELAHVVAQLAAEHQAECGTGVQCEPEDQLCPQCFEPRAQQQSKEESPDGDQA